MDLRGKLSEATKALDAVDLGKAESLLQGISEAELGTAEPRDRSEYHYLRARLLRAQGKYEESKAAIELAIAQSAGSGDDFLRGTQLLLLGQLQLALGQTDESLEALRSAYSHVLKSGEHDYAFYPKSYIGNVYLQLGRPSKALEEIDTALQHAREANDEAERRMQLRVGRMARSLVLFVKGDFRTFTSNAKELYDSEDIEEWKPGRAFILLYLGMLNVYLLKWKLAQPYLAESEKLFLELGFRREPISVREFRAAGHLFADELEDAELCCRSILDEKELQAADEAQVRCILLQVHIAAGSFRVAAEEATRAETAVARSREMMQKGILKRCLAQISEYEGNKGQARNLFQESIDLLSSTEGMYETSLTNLAIGRSESYTMEERLNHLEKAREWFESAGVHMRVVEVMGEIVNLKSGMPYDTLAIANAFLDIAAGSKEKKLPVMNVMKLEKLVYFAYGGALALYGRRLVRESVRAGRFGPVFPSVFDKFREFGVDAITGRARAFDGSHSVEPDVEESDTITGQLLRDIWSAYKTYSGIELSSMSHHPEGPWHKIWSNRRDESATVEIPDEDIREYFRSIYGIRSEND